VTFTQLLAQVDRGHQFRYLPMQDVDGLSQFGVTAKDCELGMILINGANPSERWQGSDAAEEIARRLPLGDWLIQAYRALPGAKTWGDKSYEQIRDRRYDWFGKRQTTYQAPYPFGCAAVDAPIYLTPNKQTRE
jgi:predicted DCC family thiol-disulfide oxidoreductase YuxK